MATRAPDPQKLSKLSRKFFEEAQKRLDKDTDTYNCLIAAFCAYNRNEKNEDDINSILKEKLLQYPNLVKEFNKMVPDNAKLKKTTADASNFIANVQKSLSQEDFERFKDMLRECSKNEEQETNPFINQILLMLTPFPGLVKEFKNYLGPLASKESDISDEESDDLEEIQEEHKNISPEPQKMEISEQKVEENPFDDEMMIFENLKELIGEENLNILSKFLYLYIKGILPSQEYLIIVKDFVPDNNLYDQFSRLIQSRESNRRATSWYCKPLIDLNSLPIEKVGSYLKVPKDYPLILSSGVDPKIKNEINYEYVSLAQGSEDYLSRVSRRNVFMEMLFKCEDEHYEEDAQILALEYCKKTLEELKEKISSQEISGEGLQITPELRSKLKPIESIYQDDRDKIFQYLSIHPQRTIDIIIMRISSVQEKKEKYLLEHIKQWKEIMEKNYYKSLDHRSFCFKQKEKKFLNPKNFLFEAKTRMESCVLKQTPTMVKLGGTPHCPYFFNHLLYEHEDEKSRFLEADNFKLLSNEEIESKAEILPNFRLLLNNDEILNLCISILNYAISICHLNAIEKTKVTSVMQLLFGEVLNVNEENVNQISDLPALSEGIINAISHNSFLDFLLKKLDNPNNSFIEIINIYNNELAGLKTDEAKQIENKKAKVARANARINKPVHTRKDKKDSNDENNGKKDLNEISLAFEEESNNFTVIQDKDQLFIPTVKQKYHLLYGSNHAYSFYRYFHALYERLLKIKEIIKEHLQSEIVRKKDLFENYEEKIKDQMNKIDEERFENIFISLLIGFLSNNIEGNKFEDCCKSLMGSQAYMAFTLDKLINGLVKLLSQNLGVDQLSSKMFDLYDSWVKNKFINEEVYFQKYNKLIMEEGIGNIQNTFRISFDPDTDLLSIHCYPSSYNNCDLKTIEKFRETTTQFLSNKTNSNIFVKPNSIFLKRNIKKMKKRKLNEMEWKGSLLHQFNPQIGKINYIPGNEDYMHIKKKRKDPEFCYEKYVLESCQLLKLLGKFHES